jgi:ABC-type amino acid transport substrate-binding protein/nitrogen-specific signal transduction histidine kinase
LLLLQLFVICIPSLATAKPDKSLWLSLDEQEKKYLNQHPIISVQGEDNFPPFNYVVNGKPAGYSIDLIERIGQKLGIEIKFVQDKQWHEYVEMLKDHSLDIIINMVKTPQRTEYATFTSAFTDLVSVAVTQEQDAGLATSINTIATARIAVVKGYVETEKLRQMLPNANFVLVDSTRDAIKAVSNRQADIFFASNIVSNYFIKKDFISGLTFNPIPAKLALGAFPLSIATHKDNSVLLSILQKALNALPEHELIMLRNKWFLTGQHEPEKVDLSQNERRYLEEKGTLLVSSGLDYPPVRYIENGSNKGFSIDLIEYIAQSLNIKLQYVNGSWGEHIDNLRHNKLDFMLDIVDTPQRRQFLSFSQPYYDAHYVVVIRATGQPQELSFDDLKNSDLVMIEDWSITLHLQQNYPEIKIQYADTPSEALTRVSQGKADTYVVSTAVANYWISKHKLDNLYLAPIPASSQQIQESLTFAVNKHNPELLGILNKSLMSIPPKKLLALRDKWFNETGIDTLLVTQFSTAQKQWLLTHQQLNFHLPTLGLPLSQRSPQGYKGMLADFVYYVEDKLSAQWLNPDNQATDTTKPNPIEADLTIANNQDEQLKSRFDFSEPVIKMPIVILTSDPTRVYVDNLTQLDNAKTGIVTKASYLGKVSQINPTLQLQEYDSMTSAVMAVNSGEVEVLLCPLAYCSYLMNELGTNNIRIVGQTSLHETLAFAVRKDWPELLSIINTVLSNMSPQRKNFIYQRWNTRESVLIKVENRKLLIIAIVVMGVMGVIGFVIIHNRNVTKRAAVAERYAQTVEQAHEALKNTQTKLVQAEKMASLGTLTAGVAHEINNPTNFVHVGAQNLEADLGKVQQFIIDLAGDDADEEILNTFKQQFAPLFEHLATIQDGTERIKTIVQDLRSFSRLDGAEKDPVKITDCVQSTVNLVRTKYLEVTEIVTEFNDAPVIPCHPAQLNQVFMNLIVNACDAITDKQRKQHSKQRGKITIGCRQTGSMVEISLTDNGSGMSEETKNKLFEPFYTTKGVGEGTGLGMAISFGIIEEHGGTISVQSTEGAGSVITVKLPTT